MGTGISIGGIALTGRVVLGPMAGVTGLAYRDFMKPFGVALSFSEMISDCGLAYGNQKTMQYFRTSSIDRPVGLQLFGSEIRNTAAAIEILEREAEYDFLDLNFGCPVPKVTKTGAGSAWMKRPLDLYSYVRAVVAKSAKPVTCKMRLGWDDAHMNVREIAPMMASAGVRMIAIHARTAVQGYSGKPNFEILKNIGETLPIPLCISGDIFTPEEAGAAMRTTGAQLVMVARGGLGNPELVTNINRLLAGKKPLPRPTMEQDAAYALAFARRLRDDVGQRPATMMLRGLLPHFFSGFPGYKKIREALVTEASSFAGLERILLGVLRGDAF